VVLFGEAWHAVTVSGRLDALLSARSLAPLLGADDAAESHRACRRLDDRVDPAVVEQHALARLQ
jgi:hypothetical protein